ncbi:helix-turn-helix domain-containing protein [Micromonospora echinospora]
MSQQVLADRVGRSKSWVDKVERGVRTLDRLSVIEAVAAALGVAPGVLVGRAARRTPATEAVSAVERIRAALAHYDPTGDQPPPAELDRQIGYAWTAYRHAHHPQALRMLPDLLAVIGHVDRPDGGLLVRVYQLTAQMLVKLGEPHLAWLAADRAMTAAAGHPRRTALAALPLVQSLRALDRGRLAIAVATTAVRAIEPVPARASVPDDAALAATLLTEAALAAATCADPTATHDLLDRAATCAARRPDDGGGFGAIVVDLARAVAAARLGDNHLAVAVAVAVDRIAPAEVRLRPVAHAALAAVLRAGPTPADLTRLATTLGLTRPRVR